MKGFIFTLAIIATSALAEEEKPLATKAGEAVQPVAKTLGIGIERTVSEFYSSNEGAVGDAARRNLKRLDLREREANRGPRKSMRECIKPNSMIDDDVRECTLGLREKTW